MLTTRCRLKVCSDDATCGNERQHCKHIHLVGVEGEVGAFVVLHERTLEGTIVSEGTSEDGFQCSPYECL